MNNALKFVVFSGGRGSASIARAAARVPGISVTLAVNGYDDGLSTGALRRIIPGMLGPSDFRKAISNLSLDGPPNKRALGELLETRLGSEELAGLLRSGSITTSEWLAPLADELAVRDLRTVDRAVASLAQHEVVVGALLQEDSGVALGNLVLAGAFLEAGRDFNSALQSIAESLLPAVEVLNVTDGTNLYLSAIKTSDEILWDEASIVAEQSEAPIADLSLTDQPLRSALGGDGASIEQSRLVERSITPRPNPDVLQRLLDADCIIYAPGTQHSSLFPSYLTDGLGEAIRDSRASAKILVLNLEADNDIRADSASKIVDKFRYFMTRRNEIDIPLGALATDVLATRRFLETSGSLDYGALLTTCTEQNIRLSVGDWGRGDSTHHGRSVVQVGLGRAADGAVPGTLDEVTIVVPVLNEGPRVGKVLHSLLAFDLLGEGLMPRFIAIDGGSDDGSLDVLREAFGVELISSHGGVGRALETGARAARGSLWATFPSDGEYRVEDLARVLAIVRSGEAPIAFGSRSGFCVDPRSRLDQIYGGRRLDRMMSYYGGAFLSVASTLRHRRSVADPLTSIKAFSPAAHGVLSFSGRSLDWHTRIIREASRNGLSIAELPVEFSARSRDEGKKTRLSHGVRAAVDILRGSS